MLGLTFSSKLDWSSYIISIAKTASQKIVPLILYMKFLSPELCISIYLPYAHAWNTALTSGLMSLVATGNCQISQKNRHAILSLLHLPLLNHQLIAEMQRASVFSIYITFVNINLNWLYWFHFLSLEGGLLVILIDCMIFLSPFLYISRISMSTGSLLGQLGSGIIRLQNAFL